MKPPFDPLKAGWVTCPKCQGYRWYHHGHCTHCDGEGVVVGPPADGINLAPLAAGMIATPLRFPIRGAMNTLAAACCYWEDVEAANAYRRSP